MDGLLDYYRQRRAQKRQAATNDRRLGYAKAGVDYSAKKAAEYREEARLAELAGDWIHAQKCHVRAGAYEMSSSEASYEALSRSIVIHGA
nr:hypothetical protein [Rhodococcus sp. (in: high G+C Gram-positive bacteria)]